MKRLLSVGLCAVSALVASAQQVPDPLAPSSVTPKTVEPPAGPRRPIEVIRSPRPNVQGDQPIIPDRPTLTISAIIIVNSRTNVQDTVLATNVVEVRDIPFLDRPDFQARIRPHLGRLLTENNIRDLEDDIILYCRDRGKLLVDVILVPEQNIENGVLQLWFLEGKVGTITVKNEGRKWFSDDFIQGNVRLRPADSVDSRKLNDDLNWLNNNPFRQVDVVFKPGAGLGLTDLELQVEDRLPLRPYFGYENSGTRFTGEDRLLAGFNWGNAFWLDHQFNYQYSTDVDFDLVKAHSASYLAPLPWRHNLLFYGSYVDGKADFTSTGSGLSSEAHSWQISGRYSIPLPKFRSYRHEAAIGFDFKRSNNDLLSGGTNVLSTSDTDVAQLAVSYSGLLPDQFGQTTFGTEFYYSPGDITSFNDDSDYDALRTDARANYVYGRINVERVTRLPWNCSWVIRGWGQLASERLLPSEQLALGGYNTIRGYDERVIIGDNGWIINTELRSPVIRLGLFGIQDQLQFLAFFDYGAEKIIDATVADGNDPDKTLYSTGAGLRYTVNRYFSFRVDYGIPLTEKDLNEHDHRLHIGVLLSY